MNLKNYIKRKKNKFFLRFFRLFENRRRGIQSIYLNNGVYNAMNYLLFQKYINNRSHKERKNKLNIIRTKKKIVVAFQVWNLGKWKCDS